MFSRKGRKAETPLDFEAVKTDDDKVRKYELLPAEEITDPDGNTYPMHRIRALIDIPEHGVNAGDLGGYVYGEYVLSHEGSCWVGGDALAVSYMRYQDQTIIDDASVTGNAFVTQRVSGNARISGNANVQVSIGGKSDISGNCKISSGDIYGTLVAKGNVRIMNGKFFINNNSSVLLDGDVCVDVDNEDKPFIHTTAGDKVEIKGKVNLSNVTIKGSCHIDAEVNLEGVSFKGDNTILGKPQIKPNVIFTGRNFISGDSLIPPGFHVHDVRLTGGILNYGMPVGTTVALPETGTSETPVTAPVGFSENASEAQEYVELIGQIEADYEAYTTDIVKLIKYPAMVDASIPEVIDFVSKLRAAKRALTTSNTARLKEVAEALDTAFIRAENKVRTLVASHLDENKKKSLKTAEKMFKLACDEASPEPEKRLGFKAGLRSLEGIVDVSDKAVENMKVRIGILELEA